MSHLLFDLNKIYITGTEVAYYIVCKRKLWLFSHGIELERFSDYVEIGKVISETYFKREKFKEIEMDSFKIDFIKVGSGIIVNEVKKSKKLEDAHIWQTKFYIYQLQKYGIDCKKGIIHYPKLLKKLEVEFNEEDKIKIETAMREIENIERQEKPPEVINKPYCKNCAYYQLCYI
ncbi:MAG: CRISPR-associated protein Cas4 [Candidatus Ratteibacteria bacterium]